MNEVINNLFSRKSIRAFEDKTISLENKQLIIDSAIQAPTAGNQILYTILDITDQSIKDSLAILCDNQPFIAKAPLVLIFLADCQKWYNAYTFAKASPRKPQIADLILSCEDALISAQNSVVAASSLGIGSCYIGDILENHEKVKQLLCLSNYVFPVCMLVFGYPTEKQKIAEKPTRFNSKYIVQQNKYHQISESELRSMFSEAHQGETFNFEEYITAFCKRKYMSDFAYEMNRSVSEYIKYFY